MVTYLLKLVLIVGAITLISLQYPVVYAQALLYKIEFIIPDENIKSSECDRQDFRIVSSF